MWPVATVTVAACWSVRLPVIFAVDVPLSTNCTNFLAASHISESGPADIWSRSFLGGDYAFVLGLELDDGFT